MRSIVRNYFYLIDALERIAPVIPPFLFRLILAWEFGEAGYQKVIGSNWFADITFPFPFNLIPATISWEIATWFELIGAAALILGLATRFFTASLMVLTIVAISAVHWPEQWHTFSDLFTGYRIIDEEGDGFGNYKLPLLYLLMFMPLLFGGAGKLSLDYWIKRKYFNYK
jgi:putative oxidoreductase